jgi:hypothetical protein
MLRLQSIIACAALIFFGPATLAQIRGLPKLPTSAGAGGQSFKGSVGVGFTDFKTLAPHQDFRLDRGIFMATQLERSFELLHLYLTLGLSYMDAEGSANYSYTNLSSSNNYALQDVDFRARMFEVTLGLKLKLINDYWFRPYIEGGGIGSYNEVAYSAANLSPLSTTGNDYKKKDVIMGSGYYGEAGVEIEFNERFGVKLAARQSTVQTKKLETLSDRTLRLVNETYYFSMIFGF